MPGREGKGPGSTRRVRQEGLTLEALPYRPHAGGLRLIVRLTPRAGRNGLDGLVRDADGRPALQVRLSAPPVEGAANKALIAFLSDRLGLRKGDIEIVRGQTSRLKVLQLTGDAEALERLVADWAAGSAAP